MYLARDIEKIVRLSSKRFPALIVTGPRQSGKTTLLKHLFSESYRYVSLDHPDVRLMASTEPALFFENYRPPLILDEIQYVPTLFSYLKTLIDQHRERKGQFLLTGSQSFPLMANVSESLAGRLAVLTLLGLSFRERTRFRQKFLDMTTFKKDVLRGSFPEVVTQKSRFPLQLWFSGYLQTYLERDIRQLRQVGDLMDFQRFLQMLAALNGQILNLSHLSRDLGVAVNTVKAWVSLLETSGQIFLLKPFYLNKGKRLIKSPKIYFLDTGFLCYLSGLTSANQVFLGIGSVPLFETVVLGEIVRSFYNRGMIPRIFWWRTSSGEEVDMVLEEKGKIIPIEVKLTTRPTLGMASHLVSFTQWFGEKVSAAFLVTLSGEEWTLGKRIKTLPFSKLMAQLDQVF